jgi:hypothetical protein
MSRKALRWGRVSASVFTGGVVSFGSWEAEESWEVTGCRSTRLYDISDSYWRHFSKDTYHNGHVPETFNNHGSTHSGWNL